MPYPFSHMNVVAGRNKFVKAKTFQVFTDFWSTSSMYLQLITMQHGQALYCDWLKVWKTSAVESQKNLNSLVLSEIT